MTWQKNSMCYPIKEMSTAECSGGSVAIIEDYPGMRIVLRHSGASRGRNRSSRWQRGNQALSGNSWSGFSFASLSRFTKITWANNQIRRPSRGKSSIRTSKRSRNEDRNGLEQNFNATVSETQKFRFGQGHSRTNLCRGITQYHDG